MPLPEQPNLSPMNDHYTSDLTPGGTEANLPLQFYDQHHPRHQATDQGYPFNDPETLDRKCQTTLCNINNRVPK